MLAVMNKDPMLEARQAQALQRLQALARPEQLAGLARFGLVGEGRLGLSMPQLRALGRELGRDHELALALWDSGIPDAQILAGLLADPAALTVAQMNHWVRGMAAWDVCDQCCLNALRKSPLAWARVPVWARSRHEFTRRAAFALIAVLAVHDKARPDQDFAAWLPLIEAVAVDDERNFVKKAVSWALRQIGKRAPALRLQALASAERLAAQGSGAARWIAGDVRRELAQRRSSGRGRMP